MRRRGIGFEERGRDGKVGCGDRPLKCRRNREITSTCKTTGF